MTIATTMITITAVKPPTMAASDGESPVVDALGVFAFPSEPFTGVSSGRNVPPVAVAIAQAKITVVIATMKFVSIVATLLYNACVASESCKHTPAMGGCVETLSHAATRQKVAELSYVSTRFPKHDLPFILSVG
ncbi:hypothetical protein BaRGS_00036284 [Batillaria attramentaria]|uniref:Uncharacterized protein n=1 Tax=Batillaria attramentaria TaxID=370345 RepID=A0ABD0JDI2_9CAEN